MYWAADPQSVFTYLRRRRSGKWSCGALLERAVDDLFEIAEEVDYFRVKEGNICVMMTPATCLAGSIQ
jgi:hypothetical protein